MIRKQEINYGMRSETIKLKISRIIAFDVWHKKMGERFFPRAIRWLYFRLVERFFFCQLHFITLFEREHTIHLMQIIEMMAKAEAANLSFQTKTTVSCMQAGAKKVLHDVNATFYDKNNVNAHKRIDFVERLSISFYEDATFCSTFGWGFEDFLLWIFSRILWNARARFFLAASTKFDLQ